jgi:hypothetical protein
MVLPWRFYSCVKPGIYNSRKSGLGPNGQEVQRNAIKITKSLNHHCWQAERSSGQCSDMLIPVGLKPSAAGEIRGTRLNTPLDMAWQLTDCA